MIPVHYLPSDYLGLSTRQNNAFMVNLGKKEKDPRERKTGVKTSTIAKGSNEEVKRKKRRNNNYFTFHYPWR
jgi:hypothetical protein